MALLPQYDDRFPTQQPSPKNIRLRSITNLVGSYVRTILNDRHTRNVFFFLVLNLTFAFVEILYGFWSNSLGLIGDGIHMLFDSSALGVGLIMSVVVKWDPNSRFTYGCVGLC